MLIRTVRIVALAALLHAPVAAAATMDSTHVGNWLLGAYSNDQTGQFSHCAMSASYNSGITMLFAVNRTFGWSLGFADPAWKLSIGSTYTLKLSIDGGAPIRAEAHALTDQVVEVPLLDNSALFELFRHGYELRVVAADQTFTFNLTGTAQGLSVLLNCTQQHLVSAQPSLNRDPFASASPPTHDLDRAWLKAEATTLIANVLSKATITGFHILTPGEVPSAWAHTDVVWAAPGVLGALTILTPEAHPTAASIRSGYLSSDAGACKGKFASGISSDAPTMQQTSVRLFTACEEGAKGWTVFYTAMPRPSGGYYLFDAFGLGANAPQPKSADTDIHEAALQVLSR